jgi:hypothetical protein
VDGGVHYSRKHSGYGQARDESSVRSEVARRGRPVDGAGVGRTCGSGVIGCAVTAAACNKTPHDE